MTTPTSSTPLTLPTVVAAVAVALASCGGSGAPGGSAQDDAAAIGIDARPSNATDEAAARADIERLLGDHDRIVNQIVGDPGVVTDPSAPLVVEYTALFEPSSSAVARAIANWADQAAAGVTTRPARADAPPFTSRLDGDVELVGDGEAQFPTCDEQQYATLDADGNPLAVQPGASLPGVGTAVLVDGEWRLRELDVRPGGVCAGEGI